MVHALHPIFNFTVMGMPIQFNPSPSRGRGSRRMTSRSSSLISRLRLRNKHHCCNTNSRLILFVLLVVLYTLDNTVNIQLFAQAKLQSGKLHLSGTKSEATLLKFAISSKSVAKFDVTFSSHGMYENEQQLRLHVYVDDDWKLYKKKTTCEEKVKLASMSYPIVFDYKGTQEVTKSGSGKAVELYEARVQQVLLNPPPQSGAIAGGITRGPPPKRKKSLKDRPRYFYFVVDDCNLERFNSDNKIPDMYYSASVLNGRPKGSGRSLTGEEADGPISYEHLPADEEGIRLLLVLTILFSGLLTTLLFYNLACSIGGEVHIAILIVMAACLSNGLSAICELLHMSEFQINGYGNYSLDALSGHLEAISDSMVSLVLLSIGGGWTLPADMVGVGGIGKDASSAGKFIQGIKNPASSLLGAFSGDKKGSIVAITIILVHAGLAQWGRTFDDDFDTYHALEHPPGKMLMMLRFVLGLFFVTGVGTVRSSGRCPPPLMSFLTKFALVGLSYFASLPGVSMFVGSALPYHLRHQALHWGASFVQACSLASLTWLFVGRSDASAYHRLSRVGRRHAEGDMMDSIGSSTSLPPSGRGSGSARPTMWRLGKTKIRLD